MPEPVHGFISASDLALIRRLSVTQTVPLPAHPIRSHFLNFVIRSFAVGVDGYPSVHVVDAGALRAYCRPHNRIDVRQCSETIKLAI